MQTFCLNILLGKTLRVLNINSDSKSLSSSPSLPSLSNLERFSDVTVNKIGSYKSPALHLSAADSGKMGLRIW